MSLRVVTPASATSITLAEAKAQLHVDWTDEDAFITSLIAAAQGEVERHTQRRYCAQVLEWVLDGWCERMVLPVAPGLDCSKVTISSVKYADLNGAQQTLDASTMYWARPAGPTLAVVRRWFAVWPWLGDAAERVVIRFAITSAAADTPDGVKTAMKLLISHWFRNREAVVGVDNRDSSAPLPIGVEAFLNSERWEA